MNGINAQPRNILQVMRKGKRDWKLCDMDAAIKFDEPKPEKLKISEGYMAPEMAVYTQVRHARLAPVPKR